MSAPSDVAAQARSSRLIVEECLEAARKLRKKAEELEKQSDRLRADAARDLAEAFERYAADFRGP